MSNDLSVLVGKTIKSITGLVKDSEEVRIFTVCGNEYLLYHAQDCCEQVYLADFEGDIDDLVGSLIISSEEVIKVAEPPEVCEYGTWTFYKIETSKGGLWMRWLGESNGYYSEAVDFRQVNVGRNK